MKYDCVINVISHKNFKSSSNLNLDDIETSNVRLKHNNKIRL